MQPNPALREMIFKRKSTRSYTGQALPREMLDAIETHLTQLVPLYHDIPVEMRILPAEEVRCIQPWKTPHFLALSTPDTPEALRNAGFLLQQLDLHLQSLGLGTCWVGLGRPRTPISESLPHAILMPFGIAAEPVWRQQVSQFHRKAPAEIADSPDPRLECVRLAPSATNSQPWYFLHEGNELHVYQVVQGPLKRMTLGRMNCIDMGIALCHLAICAQESFALYTKENAPVPEGYTYIGSVVLE